MSDMDNPLGDPASGDLPTKHLDEMACLLYIERQLDRARAQEVSAHAQDCNPCRLLLRAMERGEPERLRLGLYLLLGGVPGVLLLEVEILHL